MTIELPRHIEDSIIAKIHSGRFPSMEAAMTEAVRLLLERIEQEQTPSKKPKRQTKQTKAVQQPLTEEEFDKHLLAVGLMTQLPDTAADFDDPDDEPVEIKGEPLSETVIRERR